MSRFYIFIILIISSCSTVRKLKTTTVTQQEHVDTSYRTHEYQKETNVTEKSTVSAVVKADSISTSGSLSASDTTTYTQESETGGMKLKTTIKPKVKNGKIDGYDINSQAISKPKEIDVPIDKTTNIKETGQEKEKIGITDKSFTKVSIKDKETSGWGIWHTVGIVFALIVVALIMFYKLIRK